MDNFRIVFIGDGMVGWGGGIDYLCQMIGTFSFIDCHYDELTMEMHLVLREYSELSSMYEGAKVLCDNVKKICDKVQIHLLRNGEDQKKLILDISPDFCLPVLSGCYRQFSVPYVSYIPDFQSEYLPRFFSTYDIFRRRKKFEYVVTHAPYIVATSQSVHNDIKKFYPNHTARVFAQTFAPLSNPVYWDTSEVDTSKYNVAGDYFIISSQFWQHKNHITAFKAVNELVKSGKDFQLVCTGKMEDYRDINYQQDLLKYIEDNKLGNHILMLGYIPKDDQVQLMKDSIAVLQPSLFEGDPGGCSVYEAVGFGKKVIMSSIDVNLEAEGVAGISYFEPTDYIGLAKLMRDVLDEKHEKYSIEKVRKIYEQNSWKAASFYKEMMYEIVGQKREKQYG